jgi:CBS-domain-containing membrane protein
MKVHADWRDIAISAGIAALIASMFGPSVAFRLGYAGTLLPIALGFTALLLFFLWPLFRDFAMALYRVLSVRSSTGTRANVSIPAAHRTRRIPSGVPALSDGRGL